MSSPVRTGAPRDDGDAERPGPGATVKDIAAARNAARKVPVVVIGQTPPPYHGQSLAIERLVKATTYERVEIHFVRMSFSDNVPDIGSPRPGKLLHLFAIIARALWTRYRTGAKVLYYPPGGPRLVPVLRDILLLTALRPFFEATVFQFHAAGVSEWLGRQAWPLRKLAMFAYRWPTAAIQQSKLTPPDGDYIGARSVEVIPHGIEDEAARYLPLRREIGKEVRLLYVGILGELKGLFILLSAMRMLRERGVPVSLDLVGEFRSAHVEALARRLREEWGLSDCVRFAGVKVGDEKWAYFRDADVFCYPSHHDTESFGIVLVEAMMFELPVVSSRWRTATEIVRGGDTGLLCEPYSAEDFAGAIATFAANPALRVWMGKRGRERYLAEYTIDRFVKRFESVFLAAAEA